VLNKSTLPVDFPDLLPLPASMTAALPTNGAAVRLDPWGASLAAMWCSRWMPGAKPALLRRWQPTRPRERRSTRQRRGA